MNNETPKTPPIEEMIKQVLLSKREIPDWTQNLAVDTHLALTGQYPKSPLEKKPFYKDLWCFDGMTPEEIQKLSKEEISSLLIGLETEDQDRIVQRLPKDRENEFWKLVCGEDEMFN